MRETSFRHTAARRIVIAALFVMAPAWLGACGAKNGAEEARNVATDAVIVQGTPTAGNASAVDPASDESMKGGPTAIASAAASAAPTAAERAAAPNASESRTITFGGADGKAAVTLPLIGVPTEYGVDVEGSSTSILPVADLPAQAFVVPKELASKLAVYWMNLGYDERGFMMLAPKGWMASGVVGADGSFGLHAADPADPGRFLDTIDTAGGCQGCAIADIGAYFPKLAKWAEEQGFPAESPKAYLTSKRVGDRMIEFTESPGEGHGGYGVLGAAYEEHEGGSLFRSARTGYAESDQAVAETMIAFYTWMYGER